MLALRLRNRVVKFADATTGHETWKYFRGYEVPTPYPGGSGQSRGECGDSISISPDGSCVAIVDQDCPEWGLCRCTDGEKFYPNKNTRCLTNDLKRGYVAVSFSPSGKQIGTVSYSGIVCMYDVATKKLLWKLSTGHIFHYLSFSGDGTLVACGTRCGVISIRYTSSGGLFKFTNIGGVGEFCPTDNSRFAFTTGDDLVLWDIDTKKQIWKISPGRDEYNDIDNVARFSPDGKMIATVKQDHPESGSGSDADSDAEIEEAIHEIIVVDSTNGKTKLSIPHKGGLSVYDVSFSVDGSKLASACSYVENHGRCIVWDLSNGNCLLEINQSHPILSVVWGRDWVEDDRRLSVAMALHDRLGENARLGRIERELVRAILDS